MKKMPIQKMKNLMQLLLALIYLTPCSIILAQDEEYMEQVNGPEGIWTRTIAIHPDGRIFVSAQDGSFYESSDQGETWNLKSNSGNFAEAMVITDGGDIFIASSSIYRSSDDGVTWTELDNGLPSASILSLLYDQESGEVFAGTYQNGIYAFHADSGDTWEARNDGLLDFASMRITSLHKHNEWIYATGTNYSTGYIYRSNTLGHGWEVISDPITGDKAFTDITVSTDLRIFVVTWQGAAYRSDPGGINFEDVSTDLPDDAFQAIASMPSGVLLLGTVYSGIYRTEDMGDTWTKLDYAANGIIGLDCWEIAYDESNDAAFISMRNAGIFKSNAEGLIWTVKNSGLYHVEVADILITEADDIFIASPKAGVYRFIDGDVVWKWNSADFNLHSAQSLTQKSGYIFAGTAGDGIYVSTDDGDNWSQTGLSLDAGWIVAMAVGPNGYIFAGNTAGDIYRSTDDGMSWTNVYNAGDEIKDLVYNPHTATLFAALDDPTDGGVHVSNLDGSTWSREVNGLGSTRVLSLAVSPIENKMYASTANSGIYVTKDGGSLWEKLTGNNLPNWVSAVGVNSKGEIFAGANDMYSSRDDGENFISVSDRPTYTSQGAFAFNSLEYLYVGTDLEGVWKSVEPTTARTIHVAVKMKHEDGFEPSSHQVVIRGPFNNWGAFDEVFLTALNDEDLTYTAELIITDTAGVVINGFIDYKFAYTPDVYERLTYNRRIAWDGLKDLYADTVWFSNQKDFSKMTSSAISVDGTDSRGVAWVDYDNDGYEDVITTDAGASGRNDLFRNNRNGTFTQVSSGPFGSDVGDSRTASWGDYNNDGNEDLYITNMGSDNNVLYKNNGDGTFSSVTTSETVNYGGNSIGAVWADFDNDGFLDLYVTNAAGELNYLYMNNQDETFTRITGQSIVNDIGDSRGCAAADFDNDGDMDVFVANAGDGAEGEGNVLYLNDGEGNFSGVYTGTVADERNKSSGGSWGDYNNDGWLDLYVANKGGTPNILFINNKAGGFFKASQSEIPADSTFSKGSAWIDYDNDGLLDLFVANTGEQENILFRQREGGNFFPVFLGPLMEDPVTDTHGAAWGDFNYDGFQDLIIANNAGKNALYRNNIKGNHFVKVKLIGTLSNRSAIGTKVRAYFQDTDGNAVFQRRDVLSQTGYLGQNSSILTFGLGEETNIDSLIIEWPSGVKQTLSNEVAIDQLMYITEPNPIVPPPMVILNNPPNGATNIVLNPMLGWNPAGDASQYHLKFADNMSFDPILVEDTVITETAYDIGGLQRGTTYYWQVRAKNETGWGSWSETWNFTTTDSVSTTPPPQTTLNTPANGSTNIVVNPGLTWNQAGDAYQYHFEFADNVTFNPVIIRDTVVTQTSYNLSSLQYDHTYYWRVRGKNDAGWGTWSETWNFTTEQFSGTLNPPVPTNPPDGQEEMPIPAPISWTSETTGTFAVQVATDTTFSNVVFGRTNLTESYIFVSGIEYETTYYWRVNVTVSATTSDWSVFRSFTTYANQIPLTTQIPFPEHDRRDEFSSSDYLMIGLPGSANAIFNDVFGSGAGESWMAYWDNGNTGNPEDYFEPYDGSNKFRFSTGRAFWVIHNGPINVNQSLPAATLNEFAQAEVAIHPGWNMITSPFARQIAWADVRAANNYTSDVQLWRYNRSNRAFETATELEPVEGFYFNNPVASRTTLLVPYIDSFAKPLVNNELLWDIEIKLSAGETEGAAARIGTALNAKDERDESDYLKPHAFADLADIYFKRPTWTDGNSRFGSDVRPPISEIETWNFEAYTPDKTEAKLSFPGIHHLPEDFAVYLIDKTRQMYQDLREDDSYQFISTTKYSEFEVIVGEARAIEDIVSTIIPAQYSLGQNYPNPFNPETTIPLSLPEQSDVTLNVYNLLGQEVITLFKGSLNAGRHYFEWEGTNESNIKMPSGIYIYQMTTNTGIKYSGKMVLIK